MEWLLLFLLSSIATGAIAYFLKEEKTVPEKLEKQEQNKEKKTTIPEVKQQIGSLINKEDVNKFKTFINEFPTPIQPEVKHTDDLKEEIQKIRRDILRKRKPLKVTYTTDEIIPRASPFSRHRRPLQNAEKFVEEQKAKEALNIYERLEKRIPDEEIKKKIQTNIEDIKKWLMGIEEEEPIEFPEIIIPLTAQIFALEQLNEGLKQISEQIAKEISNILQEGVRGVDAEKRIKEIRADKILIGTDGGVDERRVEKEGIFREGIDIEGGGKERGADKILRVNEDGGVDVEGVEKDKILTRGKTEMIKENKNVFDVENKEVTRKSKEESFIQNYYTNVYYNYIPYSTGKEVSEEKNIVRIKDLLVPLPVGQTVPTYPEEYFKNFLDQKEYQLDDYGNLITDGMTDQDFEREWEKFKHLPLIDRRSGQDRRKNYVYDPNRPDRRSGEDRRKKDLFKERDEFLEKFKKHQERKKAFQLTKEKENFQGSFIKEILPLQQSYKEQLEKVLLPDPSQEPILEEFTTTKDLHVKDVEVFMREEKKEEIHLEKLELPENLELKEPLIELPHSFEKESLEEITNLKELPSSIQTISKLEILEPALEDLQLPDPVEIGGYGEGFTSELQEETGEEQKKEFSSGMGEALPGGIGGYGEGFTSELQEEIGEEQKKEFSSEPEKTLQKEKQQLGEGVEELDFSQIPESPETPPETKGPVQEIRGVLELKTPEEEDAPFLTLTYDFTKIPDSFQLSKNYHTLEYVYYKYKPLLIKAQEFARRKMIKNALNYYRMIKSQNIPPEFKKMINRNIQDITDYIQKFMMSRSD